MGQIGRLRQIGIGKEATKGTAVAAAFWIGVESGKVIPLVEYAQDLSNNGRIETPTQSKVVRNDAITTFSAPARSDWLGMLLKAALGSLSSATASGESAVYEHTISVLNSNDHPAYTLRQKDGITAEYSAYSMLSKLTLSCEASGLLMVEAEFIGRQLTASAATPAYTTDHIWKGSQGTIKLATDLSGLGAATAVPFHRFKLEIDKGLLVHHTFGSITLAEGLNGPLKITGELELLHAANTYRDFVTAGSERALRIAFAGDSIGNAETSELQINLAKCAFEEWDVDDGNDDLQMETIKFTAQFDQAEGTPQMIGAVLTNEYAGTAY